MTKQFLIVIIACALFSCTNNRKGGQQAVPLKNDTFAPPKVTILADLPDSLKPRTVALDTMPKPRIVMVPTSSGSYYSITNSKGEVSKIHLEPPVNKPLPVLLGANGEVIKDSSGNTFIMGTGGKSNFTTFTTENGLALDGISCSKMDKTGNLWFGTNGGGVSRYDGKSFTTFSTAQGLAGSNVIWDIAEDKKGNLWFATNGGGVSRYNGKSFTTFSTAQGLANNIVLSIVQDKKGNLWFATNGGGVSRYDGNCEALTNTNKKDKKEVHKSFTTFTTAQGLAGNVVLSIAEDKTGNLWFATAGGVSRYDPSATPGTGSKSFTTFSTAQGLAGNMVTSIAEDKTGNLWFGTNGGGVSRYDGNRAPTLCNSNKCKHNLQVGQDLDEHNKQLAKSFVTFSTAEGMPNKNVNFITEDKTGNLWFGTQGGGVCVYDGNCEARTNTNKKDKKEVRKSFTTFSTAQGLASNNVHSITEDKAGNLWFGTDGGGVSRYDGKSFTIFSTAQGLAGNDVVTIAEDKKGNLWFGTQGGGVSRYDGNCEALNGTNKKDKKEVRRSFTTFSTAQGLAANDIFSIVEDKTGNMWFATNGGGVSRYYGKSFVTFSTAQGLAGNIVFSIAEDKTGNIWFGTMGCGVSCYDGKSFTTFSTAQGLANNDVFNILVDKTGSLWFATDGGGVSRYDPGERSGTGSKSFTTFSTAQGLAGNHVFTIAEDNTGNLWFGTSEGLSVMSKDEVFNLWQKNDISKSESSRSTHIIKTFTKTDGLPDNSVTQVLQMSDGKMAVGTNLGIAFFNPSEDFTKLNNIEIYNSNTDCPVKDVNNGQGAMFLDSKGIIWAGTGSEKTALVRFDPSAVLRSKDAPTLVLNGIKVNEESICWNDLLRAENGVRGAKADSTATPAYITEEVTTFGKVLPEGERDSMKRRFGAITFDSIRRFYPIPEHLALPYEHNNVTVSFNAIETGKPGLVNYRYMLEGYDKDWSPVVKNTSATFGNIHEGSYTFKVKAQGPNGIWCEPVTYTFSVLPPWHRTWWMYSLYVITLFGTIYAIFRWRLASLVKDKEKLENTVKIRTAEVVAEKKEVERQKEVVEREKKRSDELLLNILPAEVAEELKAKGSAEAKLIDEVTVLFTDFKGFTQLSEKLSPKALVAEINDCFSAFDNIMDKYGVEKIKTIGDAYMAAGGLPTPNKTHPDDVVKAALEIQQYMHEHKLRKEAAGELFFEIRIGIHTGPVVAGIVGVKKFQYDIWGDTVNTASRMESSGGVGKVNISGSTYELVKHKFTCEYRGEIEAKGKGVLKMYYVA